MYCRAPYETCTHSSATNIHWQQDPRGRKSVTNIAIGGYLDGFILLIQGGAVEQKQILRHLFHTIYRIFWPNSPVGVHRKYPISLKKLQKGDSSWYTQKDMLRWYTKKVAHLL